MKKLTIKEYKVLEDARIKRNNETIELLKKKDYILTIRQTGDEMMSTGDHGRMVAPRRTYAVVSLDEIPTYVEMMKDSFWQHPDLLADMSNAEDIPFEEKQWGMYYDLEIQPLSKDKEERYLEMSEYGFFEKYRGVEERKLQHEKVFEGSIA
jgi:hypothetical protein